MFGRKRKYAVGMETELDMDAGGYGLRTLSSGRLRLVAATRELVEADLAGSDALGLALGAGASLRRASRRAREPGGRAAVGLVGAALLAFATSVSVGFHAVPTLSLIHI